MIQTQIRLDKYESQCLSHIPPSQNHPCLVLLGAGRINPDISLFWSSTEIQLIIFHLPLQKCCRQRGPPAEIGISISQQCLMKGRQLAPASRSWVVSVRAGESICGSSITVHRSEVAVLEDHTMSLLFLQWCSSCVPASQDAGFGELLLFGSETVDASQQLI